MVSENLLVVDEHQAVMAFYFVIIAFAVGVVRSFPAATA
jgi:hypothetical protein